MAASTSSENFDPFPEFDINLLTTRIVGTESTDSKQEAERFATVTDSDVDKLIEGEENKNTKRKTYYDLKFFKQFLEEQHKEEREIQDIPPSELNLYLSQFIVAARTKTGKDYEPSSLRGILSSVERHLSRLNYGKSIFKDCEFQKTRDALKSKQKELKRHGRGSTPRATTALSDEEIEILFEKKLLGISSPQALQNTVWLNNMIHFGLRGCTEQRELCWGDVVLKTDIKGMEYLEFSERQTKTRTGENPRNQRQVKPRMYANKAAVSVERDPVHVYKVYKEKRPQTMSQPESCFYLAINCFKSQAELLAKDSKWFKAQPMGVNKLNSLMKEMTQTAGIPTKTNHGGRKTLVQKLQDNNIPANQIIQITGHKNLQSVNNYSSLRENQLENISHILSGSSSASNAVMPAQQLPAPQSFPVQCQLSQSSSSTATSVDYNENRLQSLFYGNYITGGVFNINLAPAKNTVETSSPELRLESQHKKRRYILESDSSQEST